jgi:hypothetical protein
LKGFSKNLQGFEKSPQSGEEGVLSTPYSFLQQTINPRPFNHS